MRGLLTVTRDSFLLLRRDRIFVPAAIGGLLVGLFANLAGGWTVEDWQKVLFDIGSFGFNVIGSLVAIFWSTKSVADARSEGSLEIQIAAPVSRATWLMGKYLGLVLSLTFLAAILVSLWQGLLLLKGADFLTTKQFLVFFYLFLGWCVLGSVGTFFASFCGQATALFSSLALWFVGLAISFVPAALSPQTDANTRLIIERIAWAWDLQRFNLLDPLTNNAPGLRQLLQWNGLYGLALITMLLTAAILIFKKKDLIT